MITTNEELKGLLPAIYRYEILQSQLKILVKIYVANLVQFMLTWLIFTGPVTN